MIPDLRHLLDVIGSCVKFSHAREVIRPTFDISTNATIKLPRLRELLGMDDVSVGISLNTERLLADGRSMDSVVIENLRGLTSKERAKLTVNVVVLPSVLESDPDELFGVLDDLGVSGLHFLQYSDAIIAREHHTVSGRDFERFYETAIKTYETRPHRFVLYPPKSEHLGNYNQHHVFVNPYGQFGLLDVNMDGQEFFRWFERFEDWEQTASSLDLKLVIENNCFGCEFCGWCVGEHLKYTNPTDVCAGLPNLSRFLNLQV